MEPGFYNVSYNLSQSMMKIQKFLYLPEASKNLCLNFTGGGDNILDCGLQIHVVKEN